MRYLLGVDLGTTAIKVALFDENGAAAAVSTQEHRLITPTETVVEQDPEVYWNCFKAGTREVLERSGVAPRDILALSVSAQGETLLVLDGEDRPLRNAIVWMDNRAQAESDALAARFTNETIHKVTGQVEMTALWPAAKIKWIRDHEPEVYDRAAKYLLLEDWFFMRLMGGYYGEGSLWCSTILWNITTKTYWPEMVEELGLRRDQLPEIVESGTPLGTILPAVAEELGLDPSLQLVMGGLDQSCGAIGVGNVREGVFSESTGAALAVCAMTPRPAFDPNRQMPCFYTAIPGMYMIHAFSSGGIAYKWLRDTLCTQEADVAARAGMSTYDIMNGEATQVPAGSEGLLVLPHFQSSGPPDSEQSASALIYGLALKHTKGHIVRGFMEGVAMVLLRMTEAVRAMGVEVREIRSLSGGAKSPLWCQIKADATGVPVVTMTNTDDAACLGAAILAGVGAGLWDSVPETAERFARPERRFEPDPKNRAAYDQLIEKYKAVFAALRPVFKKFS